MNSFPLFKVHVDTKSALRNVGEVFESGFLNEGVQVAEFERQLSRILDAERLLVMNSCTSALTVALKLAGVGPGDDVVSTPMTCIATNSPVDNLGGRVVWADINAETGSIDPDDVATKITSQTKAVMCVAWAGTPCDLDALRSVCRDAGIPLIQDAAHALCATYHGKSIIHFADYTCYSFQAIKHLTCGDGGALVCADEASFQRAKKLKWFGYDREASKDAQGNWRGQLWDVDIDQGDLGFKYNMNNVAAAIGLSQLPHLGRLLNAHRRNAAIYDEIFQSVPTIEPLRRPANCEPSFWVYTVLLKNDAIDRNDALARLNTEGIAAGVVHVPNDVYSCFKANKAQLPAVRKFATRQISYPVGWWLNEDDIRYIGERVTAICA